MQWLIDIIKAWTIAQNYATEAWVLAKGYATEAWVLAKGYITEADLTRYLTDNPRYVKRNCTGSWDWDITDFVADGAWHTLDCSGILPRDVKAIHFRVSMRAIWTQYVFRLSTPGETHGTCPATVYTQVANITTAHNLIVTPSAGNNVIYTLSPGTWTFLYLKIEGWWI